MLHHRNGEKKVTVFFEETLPEKWSKLQQVNTTMVAKEKFREEIKSAGFKFVSIESLTEPGSVYEASAYAEELSYVTLPDGSRLTRRFTYRGYELWWIHYNDLFLYFCTPYIKYRKLLSFLKGFQTVNLFEPPHKNLFLCYLKAYERQTTILRAPGVRIPHLLHPGLFVQVFFTVLSIPVLAVSRPPIMVFTGDKFEKNKDYDFRMGFIYEEFRARGIPFVEFIRSLEPLQKVIRNIFTRKRAVIYSEAVSFVGEVCSRLLGGRVQARRQFGETVFVLERDPEKRFKLMVASQYLFSVYDDVWTIRIMRWILRAIGSKSAFFAAATERNFHSVLACKLNNISTVGILHGVSSRYATPYDYLPGYDGKKSLSVDTYGVWSDWWKEHYNRESRAYKPEQLYVSGPMRPLEKEYDTREHTESASKNIKVLFVAEQTAEPHEVMPYVEELLRQNDLDLTIKFRPYRDGFEEWLLEHRPDILKQRGITVVKGSMQDAIRDVDVVVGCHSTGVLEALLQLKVPLFMYTNKWKDYYNLKDFNAEHSFIAENPKELIEKIKKAPKISSQLLEKLQSQYFGDPYRNGSTWVVDKLVSLSRMKNMS